MFKKILVLSVVSFALLAEDNATQNFESIDVQGSDRASIFAPQDYLESQTYLQAAPSQKRLTITEAMSIPGIQGDPIKALKVLAGVTPAGSNGSLIVHAAKSSETLATLNHLPLGYLFHFNGLHSVISPEATEQLDLYLGAFDNTYNAATGGILDITPKYPMGDNSGFVHVGLFDSSFGLDLAITDATSLYVGARRSYFDLLLPLFTKGAFKSPDSNTSVDFTQFPAYWDTTLLLSHIVGNNQFSYEMVIASDEMKMIVDGNVKDPKANGDLDIAKGFATHGLRWKYEDDAYKANSLLYYLYTYNRINVFTQTVDANVHYGGFKHISTFELDKHQFTAGVDAQLYYIPVDLNISKPPASDQPRSKFTDAPVFNVNQTLKIGILTTFAQDVYSFAPNWKLRYGLSYAYSTFGNLKHNVDPRAAIIYALTPNDEFSLAGGAYTQAPVGTTIMDTIGNPDLLFEHAYHINAHYKHTFDEGHYFEIEPYYKRYEQLAINDTTNTPSKNYLSVGKGTAKGVDLTYKLQSDELYILGSYTWVSSFRQLDSADSTLYPFSQEIPHTLNLVGSYKLSDNWSLSGLLTLKSGARYTPVVGATKKIYVDSNTSYYSPIYGEKWSKQLAPYFTLNLKAAYTQELSKDQRIEYSFEIMNITNNQNQLGVQYEDDYSNYDNPTYRMDLPLLPWFDITYHF